MKSRAIRTKEKKARQLGSIRSANRIYRQGSHSEYSSDIVIAEEPLELWLHYEQDASDAESFIVTMRTPGMDVEWARGFLISEGIVKDPGDIVSVYLAKNKVYIRLKETIIVSEKTRKYPGFSSCGVCGKKDIDALGLSKLNRTKGSISFNIEKIQANVTQIAKYQDLFELTGGVHAAALFNENEELIALCEDVGRHNAVDKLIGLTFDRNVDYSRNALWMSSRISYEIVQKAASSGIPLVIGLGAVSSLAIELADQLGITIIGFLGDESYSLYTHAFRVYQEEMKDYEK